MPEVTFGVQCKPAFFPEFIGLQAKVCPFTFRGSGGAKSKHSMASHHRESFE